MYLLGAPRFTIITAHKLLLLLFNKATSQLPPKIENWVMSMQDVNFDLVNKPGRDDQDPLDFLSRHPLRDVRNKGDIDENIVRKVMKEDHSV